MGFCIGGPFIWSGVAEAAAAVHAPGLGQFLDETWLF
jgi:hypothetical protein